MRVVFTEDVLDHQPDEIVSALAYREDLDEGEQPFDLAKAIDELVDALHQLSFGRIDRVMVLRVLLAALEEGLGVKSARLLPYAMQWVALCEFFRNCPNPSNSQRKLLERWFWVSSFTGWFGHGNSSRTTRLINEFREVAKDPNAATLKEFRLNEPALPLPSTFDLRSARIRAHVLVLLSLQPRYPDGRVADDAWRHLEDTGPRAFGYIFTHPKPTTGRDRELRSCPANRILNLGKQSGQAKRWLRDVGTQQEILESHCILPDSMDALDADDAERFLEARLNQLRKVELEFMAHCDVTSPRDVESTPEVIDTGEE